MKSGALVLGIVVSVFLLATAGGLYWVSGDQSTQPYRTSIELIRQAEQLSSSWSIEIARVRSDPLADFDSLAAFIPRMDRIEERLADTARRIPDIPDRLASDVQVYLSMLDTKEERIERFKTGYAVVRNSARYLPLAAANVMRQAEDAGNEPLARSISILLQSMNLYLAAPSDIGRERLGADVERMREDSLTYPPPLANALANLLAHAEVLLERQAPTDVLFHEATSNESSDVSNPLIDSLEREIARQEARAANYDRGILAAVGALALFWIALVAHQRTRGVAPAASEVPETAGEHQERPPAAPIHDEPAQLTVDDRGPAATTPAGLNAEAAMLYRFFSERVGRKLATTAERVGARIDDLHRSHRRLHAALQDSEAMVELPDGTDLDDEIEAGLAVADHLRREVNGMAYLSRRLASFSGLPNGEAHREMIDVNACVGEVVAAIGAEDVADVTKRLGNVPEIFASRTEIRLLLAQFVENSVHAVEGLAERKAAITIETARMDEEIVITIIDNGNGIAAERRKQIFRPFYTSRDGGMGLGLTLASHLVKKVRRRHQAQLAAGSGDGHPDQSAHRHPRPLTARRSACGPTPMHPGRCGGLPVRCRPPAAAFGDEGRAGAPAGPGGSPQETRIGPDIEALVPNPASALAEALDEEAEPDTDGSQLHLPRAREPIKPIPEHVEADPEKAALGRALFHDPRLSTDDTISCASCHDLANGGDDGKVVSRGHRRTGGNDQRTHRLQRGAELQAVLGRPGRHARRADRRPGAVAGGAGQPVAGGHRQAPCARELSGALQGPLSRRHQSQKTSRTRLSSS